MKERISSKRVCTSHLSFSAVLGRLEEVTYLMAAMASSEVMVGE